MFALVIAGTLVDIVHKGSARYFFANRAKAAAQGTRKIGGGKMAALAVRSAVVDVMMSGEFCNPRRQLAHLLTMYGFVLYAVTSAIMIFGYTGPGAVTPAILPALWYLGALMVCAGGYWFWFFIRVDVAAEGHSPFRVVRADLFILSLLASVTAALVWAWLQSAGLAVWPYVFLALYVIATAVLFGSIPWSKFAHMFFKPAAALARRIDDATGQRRNLPAPADKPATFGSARKPPRHY
jgi:hypothetical protein